MYAYPFGQCTWLAAILCPWLPNTDLGNADSWPTAGEAAGLWLGDEPTLGAVACLPAGVQGASGRYGHVAIVDGVGADAFSTLSADWPGGDAVSTLAGVPLTRQRHTVGAGIRFLTPSPVATSAISAYTSSDAQASADAARELSIVWYDSIEYESWLIVLAPGPNDGVVTVDGPGLHLSSPVAAGATAILRPAAYRGPISIQATVPVLAVARALVP